MNKLYALLICIILSAVAVAQPDEITEALMKTPEISVQETAIDFRGASQNSFTAFIVADNDDYLKDLKNWMKNKYAIEAKRGGGFFSSSLMIVPVWSADSLIVHYKVDKDGHGARVNVLVEQKQQFVSTVRKAAEAMAVKTGLEQQIRDFYIKYYDSKISDQQKYYDRQAKDLAQLRKKAEKISGEIANHNKAIQNNENETRNTNGKLTELDNKIKTYKSTSEQQKKETAQIQKEADANLSRLRAKQAEYDSYNKTGDLNTKPAMKAIKEKEKLEKSAQKLQDKLTKNKEALTKTENNSLKAEQEKIKLNSKLDDLKSRIDQHQNEIDSLKRDLESNDRDIHDKEDKVNSAKNDLDKLKSAKSGIIG